MAEPPALAVLTVLAIDRAGRDPAGETRCSPWPSRASAIFVHISADWPEGAAPMAVLLLTYTRGGVGHAAPGRRSASAWST